MTGEMCRNIRNRLRRLNSEDGRLEEHCRHSHGRLKSKAARPGCHSADYIRPFTSRIYAGTTQLTPPRGGRAPVNKNYDNPAKRSPSVMYNIIRPNILPTPASLSGDFLLAVQRNAKNSNSKIPITFLRATASTGRYC